LQGLDQLWFELRNCGRTSGFFELLSYEALLRLAPMVDGLPKVMALTVDLHKDRVEMSPPAARSHALDAAFPDLPSEHRTEPMPPKSDRLMTDSEAAFAKQIFYILE